MTPTAAAWEMFGYQCTLQTDTEVMAYIADYLLRRQGLTLEETASVMAAPSGAPSSAWSRRRAERLTYLRKVFQPAADGAVLHHPRLFRRADGAERPVEAAEHGGSEKDDRVFISSEEAAIGHGA